MSSSPSSPFLLLAAAVALTLAACGGLEDPTPASGPATAAVSHTAAVSFSYSAPSTCIGECPESQPVLADASVVLMVRGLMPYRHYRARALSPAIADVTSEVSFTSCSRSDTGVETTRRLGAGEPACGSAETADGVQQIVLKTGIASDGIIEIVDDTGGLVDATTVRARAATDVQAHVSAAPDRLGEVATSGIRDGIVEVRAGTALVIVPRVFSGSDLLAFSDGIDFTVGPDDILATQEPGAAMVVPAGSALARARAEGTATIGVKTATVSTVVNVRVLP